MNQATEVRHDSGIWVDRAADLCQRLDTGRDRGPLALDTEFVRERTYWPILALAQIAAPDEITLVDVLAEGMPEALRKILGPRSGLKIMHSASEDLVALRHTCGAVPEPLFDTQIAAALAGLGAGLSYQALARDLLGVELEKGETRSDWLRRPLSESQLHYASDDVRHLHALHELLSERLRTLGREHWLEQDCQRLLAASGDEADPWPHLAVRSSQGLDPEAQRRLWALLRWRDWQAVSADRPRGWILANDLAVLLARRPPDSPAALDTVLSQHPNAPRRLRDAVWQALETAPSATDDFPLALPQDAAAKRQLRLLQDVVAALAQQVGLPPSILASRRHLQALLDGRHWPEPLCGWRRELLEPVLRPLISTGG